MKIKDFKIDDDGNIIALTECGRLFYKLKISLSECQRGWHELTEDFPHE